MSRRRPPESHSDPTPILDQYDSFRFSGSGKSSTRSTRPRMVTDLVTVRTPRSRDFLERGTLKSFVVITKSLAARIASRATRIGIRLLSISTMHSRAARFRRGAPWETIFVNQPAVGVRGHSTVDSAGVSKTLSALTAAPRDRPQKTSEQGRLQAPPPSRVLPQTWMAGLFGEIRNGNIVIAGSPAPQRSPALRLS